MLKILRLLLFAAVLAAPVLARAESALWISVDQAPVRVWRSAQAEVLLRLPRGTVVQPLYAQEPWTRVREPGGQQGWVYQGHLSATPQPPALADIFNAAPETRLAFTAGSTSNPVSRSPRVPATPCTPKTSSESSYFSQAFSL